MMILTLSSRLFRVNSVSQRKQPVLVTSKHEIIVDRDHYAELVEILQTLASEEQYDPVAMEDRINRVLDEAADPYGEQYDEL